MSIALLDAATEKVHVFPVQRGVEVTVKEFVTAVEETLTRALSQEKACVRVLCAAVGASCINICDKVRTVHYYLLDAKPWFIRTGVFSSDHADLHIKETAKEDGNEAAIKMDVDRSYIRDLKQRFAKMTCNFFPNLHFIFEKRELENDKKISEYNLTNGSVVSCLCGKNRTVSFGTPYIYVTPYRDRGEDYDTLSPVWRRATPGMWLEGKCSNKICVAHSKLVVMNQGFADLDFTNEKLGCKCPMCYERVVPTGCGFNRCEWTTVGLKRSSFSSERPQVVRQDWQRLEESYRFFIPNKDIWQVYKVACKELSSPNFCVVCMTSPQNKSMQTAPCGHTVHLTCAKDRKDCLQCIGEQNMTSYQSYF